MHIKKKFLFWVLLVSFYCSNAQLTQILEAAKPQKAFNGIPALKKKSQFIQIGIGTPNNVSSLLNLGGLVSLVSSGSSKGVGPIFANYEYLIKDNLGLGAGLLIASGQQDYNSGLLGINSTAKLQLFQFAVHSSYHLYTTDKLDPYIKGAIGFNLWNGNATNSSTYTAPTPFGYQGLVGLKYFVKPEYFFFGELGYGTIKLTANIGVGIKLK